MHTLTEGSDADSEDFPSKETEVEEGTEHTDRHTEHTTSVYTWNTVNYYKAIQLKL